MWKIIILVTFASVIQAWKLNSASSTDTYKLLETGLSPIPTLAPELKARAGGIAFSPEQQICGYIGGNNGMSTLFERGVYH